MNLKKNQKTFKDVGGSFNMECKKVAYDITKS